MSILYKTNVYCACRLSSRLMRSEEGYLRVLVRNETCANWMTPTSARHNRVKPDNFLAELSNLHPLTNSLLRTPALGYLYQMRVALLWALRKLKESPDFMVSLETLDDVVF